MTERDYRTTESVLQHHLEAFATQDMEAILVDYAPSATVVSGDRIAQGHDEIRGFFEWAFGLLPKGSSFDLDQQFIKDDIAYITWQAESPSVRAPMGSDTFIVRDGLIQTQTVAAYMEPKA